MNLWHLIPDTKSEGPGHRFGIWFQGCSRHCPGCFAEATWPHTPHILRTPAELAEEIADTNGIEGITVLGGEPFEQAEELAALLDLIPSGLSVIIFTGYTLEELTAQKSSAVMHVLEAADVLVDGPFQQDSKQNRLPMIGSSNQKFHFLTDRYTIEDFPSNRMELRVRPDGGIVMNGMGNLDMIRQFLKERGYGI